MLEELTAYSTFGSPVVIDALIGIVADDEPCTARDLRLMIHNKGTAEKPMIEAAVSLLCSLDLCRIDEDGIVRPIGLATQNGVMTSYDLGCILLSRMVGEGLIPRERIEFDARHRTFSMHSSALPMRYSQMRNFLISVGVIQLKDGRLIFDSSAIGVMKHDIALVANKMTPEMLQRKLERDAEAGRLAESFVMRFEGKRLGLDLLSSIEQVSLISVSAGYDIASFETPDSIEYDRFIEVKAVGRRGFHFSANELAVAKRLLDRYCIYLVDLQKIMDDDYAPTILRNPSKLFENPDEWRITPDSYHVTYIG